MFVYNDSLNINLYSYTVHSIHLVEKELSALDFIIVTCDQCLLICFSVFFNVLFFSYTLLFRLDRMCQSCVMSCRGKKCWFRNTCLNCTTGSRCLKK